MPNNIRPNIETKQATDLRDLISELAEQQPPEVHEQMQNDKRNFDAALRNYVDPLSQYQFNWPHRPSEVYNALSFCSGYTFLATGKAWIPRDKALTQATQCDLVGAFTLAFLRSFPGVSPVGHPDYWMPYHLFGRYIKQNYGTDNIVAFSNMMVSTTKEAQSILIAAGF